MLPIGDLSLLSTGHRLLSPQDLALQSDAMMGKPSSLLAHALLLLSTQQHQKDAQDIPAWLWMLAPVFWCAQSQGCSRLPMPGQPDAGLTQFTAVQAVPGHAAAGSLLCGHAVHFQQVSCNAPMLSPSGLPSSEHHSICCRHLSELLARLEDHAYGMTPDPDVLWGPPVKPARPSARPSQVHLLPCQSPLVLITGFFKVQIISEQCQPHRIEGAASSSARTHAFCLSLAQSLAGMLMASLAVMHG